MQRSCRETNRLDEIFSGLYRAGYDGPAIIEHGDRKFEGSGNAVKRGFRVARNMLRPYVK